MALQLERYVFVAIRCVYCRQPAANVKGEARRCTACERYICAACFFLHGNTHECKAQRRADRARAREHRGTD